MGNQAQITGPGLVVSWALGLSGLDWQGIRFGVGVLLLGLDEAPRSPLAKKKAQGEPRGLLVLRGGSLFGDIRF